MTGPATEIIAANVTGGGAQIARAAASGDALGEATLQTIVVQHLQLRAERGAVWMHVPNGGLRSRAEAGRLKAQGTVAGAPDLLIFFEGRTYALELKTVNGRISGAQKAMHQALEAAGVNVAVSFGLNATLVQLANWGIIRS